MKLKAVLAILILVLLDTQTAFSQNLPQEEPSVTEQKRMRRLPPEKKLPPEAKPVIKRIQPKEAELPPEADKEFFVKEILFSGNSLVSSEEIKKITQPFANNTLTLRKLIKIADSITELYQARGYVTSQAYVPAQKIENDTVSIKIIEGRVGQIYIQGNKAFKTNIFERGLNLLKGKVLEYNKLLKELLYLNQNPDREVTGVIQAGKEPQESDILVKVKEKSLFHSSYEINNFGTPDTGRRRHAITVAKDNPMGLDDTLTFAFQTSEINAFNGYLLKYDLPLTFAYEKRTKLSLLLTYAQTTLKGGFKDLDVQGNAASVLISLSQELFNNLRLRCLYDIGFEASRAVTDQADTRTNNDQLRSLRTSFLVEEYDSFGRMSINNELKVGFADFLGASAAKNPSSSREGAGGRFVKYSLGLTRINKFIPPGILLFSLEAQTSFHNKLSDLEHMSIGGIYSVRGYPEGEAGGDYGFLSISELRWPVFFIPQYLKVSGKRLKDACQFALFADSGSVFLKQPATTKRSRNLTSLGVGLRFNLSDYTYGRLDVAWPVGDKPTDNKRSPLVYYSFTAGF